MTDLEELKKQLREKGSYAHTTMPPKPSIESHAVDAIEQLQRELEEARRDAERYRWLRKNWHNIQIGFDGPNIDCLSLETRSGHAREMKDIAGFNEAIDEARGAITPTLICPSCGVDRYREKCKGSLQNCPIQAIAHNAARQQKG